MGAGCRKDTPGTALSEERTKGIILGGANLWGWAEQPHCKGTGKDDRSRMLESVGIVEAKERDNHTIKLAINVTCH